MYPNLKEAVIAFTKFVYSRAQAEGEPINDEEIDTWVAEFKSYGGS